MSKSKGFTLIEMLVVLAAIALLLSIAAPRYVAAVERAEEAALRENLTAMRKALDQYGADNATNVDSLQTLVTAGYLSRVPVDPMTGRSDTWQLSLSPNGAMDVRSGSSRKAKDGSAYAQW